MSVNYAKQFSTRPSRRRTPQSEAIPGSNQVPNSAGGFSWQITSWQQFERFLVLGAEGGTYYIKQDDLIKRNHGSVVACIKEDGVRAVKLIEDVSVNGRAYKNDPAIFALALVTVHGDEKAKAAAFAALPKVCRIGTHLFHFNQYVSNMRGWGRGLANAVRRWYANMPVERLAYQVVKYQQRDGWSHRDVLRQAHPSTENDARGALFRWIVAGNDSFGERTVKRKDKSGKETTRTYAAINKEHLPPIVQAFEQAKSADEKTIVKLIADQNLPREAIPTQHLNSVKVWDALLQKMPLTALIRNLGKMTSIDLVKPLSEAAKLVVSRLENVEALKKARIHPMSVLIALKQYSAGHGSRGSLSWKPVEQVVDALDEAFYLAFGNVTPIGKPVLLGLDVSASMCSSIGDTNLTCAEAAAALSLVTASVEKEYLIMGFDQGIRELRVSPRMRLDTVLKNTSNINGGGTDCALPMLYAAKEKLKISGFVVLTDSETWAGNVQPSEALRDYRSQHVADAREVVVGMTSSGFSIADPNDAYALDVVGFDTTVPNVISDFVRGEAASKSDAVEVTE